MTAARDPGGFAKCGKAGKPDYVFHRSHEPKEDTAQGVFAFPESQPVRLDPSIRTAGQIASENARRDGEYPDLASVRDAPDSRPSLSRDHEGDDARPTEIAS